MDWGRRAGLNLKKKCAGGGCDHSCATVLVVLRWGWRVGMRNATKNALKMAVFLSCCACPKIWFFKVHVNPLTTLLLEKLWLQPQWPSTRQH